MVKRKSLHISRFFEGERIERVEPARWPWEYGVDSQGKKIVKEWYEDHTFYHGNWERHLLFKGIYDGKIHILDKNDSRGSGNKKAILWKLDYEDWQNGWARYVTPEKLTLLDEKCFIKREDSKNFLDDFTKNYSN